MVPAISQHPLELRDHKFKVVDSLAQDSDPGVSQEEGWILAES